MERRNSPDGVVLLFLREQGGIGIQQFLNVLCVAKEAGRVDVYFSAGLKQQFGERGAAIVSSDAIWLQKHDDF